MQGNPVASKEPDLYFATVVDAVPTLTYFDGASVTQSERQNVTLYFQELNAGQG